jgi:transglutaminase-like putative cysteine protease
MKRFLITLVLFALCIAVLNIDTVTRRCVNGACQDIHIPLYMKALCFIERDYNYKQLAAAITRSARSPEERVLRIFTWSRENIRRVPQGFPLVDDHIWNIIVRGYGSSDQVNDVFAALCVYAGVPAYWGLLRNPDSKIRVPVSYVYLDKQWFIFDPYRGICFRDPSGALASVDDLLADTELLKQIPADLVASDNTPYRDFYRDLKRVSTADFARTRQQMPLLRLTDIIRAKLQRKK